MANPTTIHAFPELADLANREADDLHTRMDLRLSGVGVEALRAAVLAQLCDLNRPASRDAVARLVAVKMGYPFLDVVWGVETTGGIRSRLLCGVGCTSGAALPPAEALAIIVLHLWPEEAPRG